LNTPKNKSESLLKEIKNLQEKVQKLEKDKERNLKLLFPGLSVIDNFEKSLVEKEEKLKLAIEIANIGIWEWDLRTNKVSVSEKLADILRIEKEKKIDSDQWLAFIHPEDQLFCKGQISQSITDKSNFSFEHRTIVQNQTRWVISKGLILADKDGITSKIMGNVMDITERKLIEESLKEKERSISTLMGNLPGMAYRCKNDKMFTMEFVSERCFELTEYPQQEILSVKKTFASVIYPKDKEKVNKIIKSAVDSKNFFKLEYRILTASGKLKWVWEQGSGIYDEECRCTHLEGFITDISDRKEFEGLIRQSRKNFKNLVENSPVGVFIIQDEKIVYSNPVARSILKFTDELRLNKTAVFDFILPEFHPAIKRKFQETKESKKIDFTEIKLLASDGSVLDVEASGKRIEFLGKTAIQFVFNDISIRKQLQKEQLRAELAEETNKNLQKEIEERLKVELKLKENQKFTKRIIDSSLDMIVANNENGQFIEFNEAAQKGFGYSVDEAKKINPEDLFFDSKQYQQILKTINKKGKFSGEILNKTKDGAYFTTYISAAKLIDENGNSIGSMGVSRDISEIKKHEKIKEIQYSVSRVLNEAPSFSEAAIGILSAFIYEMDFAFGEVWLKDPVSNEIHFFKHQVSPGYKKKRHKSLLKLSKKETANNTDSLPHRIFKAGKAVWIEDICRFKNAFKNSEAIHSGLVSCFGFPIKIENSTIGVINFYSEKIVQEDKDLKSLFIACGGQIGQYYKRKKAEEELRESEERFKAIYNVAAVGIARINLKGEYVQVNKKFLQFIGYSEKEILKRKFKDITHPEDVGKSIDFLNKLVSKELNSFTAEKRYIHKSGSVVFINVTVSVVNNNNGEPDYFVSVVEDITHRKLSQEQLFKQAAKLNSIIESSSHQIWTMNRKRELTSFNQNYFKTIKSFFGVEVEVGINLRNNSKKMLHKSTYSVVDKLYEGAFRGVPQHFEFPFRQKNGKEIWLETFLNPIKLKNGKIEEIACIAQDITEKKLSEAQIKGSLKEKEVLLKEVHHRVKNNLQVITSILSLQSTTIKDKKILDFLSESQNRIKSMAYIHESLYQTKDFTRINFSEYIQSLSKNLLHSYNINNKSIGLRLDIEDVYLNLDLAIPCGLIINELVSNALKYAFPRGAKGNVGIKLQKKGKTLALSVRDSGIGFPQNLDFRNTESLGLQLVTTLTEQISGEISMKSTASKGTEFLIKFKTK
jgi:PAS domain S-box-containing protein